MSNSLFTAPPAHNSSENNSQNFDEHEWVINVRKTLEEECEGHNEIPVNIYSVPATLKFTNPDVYTPQQVALGPYHHWRQEVYEMERYKIAAARRIMENCKCFNTFQEIVDQLHMLETRIRACYHKYLSISSETLTWMMAIDVSFLLEFLEIYTVKEGMLSSRAKSRLTSHIFDSAGRKSAQIEILRDILMLENQIPLFLARKMLEFELGSLDAADGALLLMLKGLSKELYPFKIPELPKDLIKDSAHVLDFFYRLLMPKAFLTFEVTEVEKPNAGEEKDEKNIIDEISNNRVTKFFNVKLNIHPVRVLKSVMNSKPLKSVLNSPRNIITKMPMLKMLKGPIDVIFKRQNKDDVKPETYSNVCQPLMEELTIPSVTKLHESGVFFVPTNGGICSMNFNVKTRTLTLPRVNLDVNTGTVMRNLVAYETCHASGPLIFTRYTELMNGIIDTKDDVKLLRRRGIILNRLKSDEEAANLWNGMSRSLKLTKVPLLDNVVADVNKYYNGVWKVKAEKCIRSYIYGSWRILTVLTCLVMLCMMALQTLCSVYTCSGVLNQNATIIPA